MAALTCKEVVEIVRDYLAGALATADQVRFEQHLHACTWCMTYVRQLQQTVTAVGTLAERAVAPTTHAELLAGFRHWRRGR